MFCAEYNPITSAKECDIDHNKAPMKITIYQGHEIKDAVGVFVIIDVLRAFTTAPMALFKGSKEIILVGKEEEAFSLYEKNPKLLLMGENEGVKIKGFHFGNSPSEIEKENLEGKTLLLRTSSGTQGVVLNPHGTHTFATSFVTASATLQAVETLKADQVSLIATGRKNGDEDLSFAEYFKARLEGKELDPSPFLERVKKSPAAKRMLEGPTSYPEGKKDLDIAMELDLFPFAVEVFNEGGLFFARRK